MRARVVRKGKKNINPRYFLNETTLREHETDSYDHDDELAANDPEEVSSDLVYEASRTFAQLSAGGICGTHSEVRAGIEGLNKYLHHFDEEEREKLVYYREELRKLLRDVPEYDSRDHEGTKRASQEVGWSFIEQIIRYVYSMYEKAGLIEWGQVKEKTRQFATCPEAKQYNLEEAIKKEINKWQLYMKL
tara:strand:+ start:2830 stop:3399 length:570 start_codon:yes stop_codon:yes gene_type:complete